MIYLSMTLSNILRYTFLAIFNALIVYAVPLTLAYESWFFLSLIIVIGLLVNFVYFTDKFQPMKWILPGMIFMLSFVVFPAVYNTFVSFTNWSTGHILTKTQAINVLEDRVYTPENQKGLEFEMYILQDIDLNFYYVAYLDDQNILYGKAVSADEIFSCLTIFRTNGDKKTSSICSILVFLLSLSGNISIFGISAISGSSTFISSSIFF